MIKVSVIIPVYNTEKYLKKCVDSILNQTLDDIEIILINDGSSDNSQSIIDFYQDKRIKKYTQKNKGIGKTRNKGIEYASGEYVMFIDSDDYIDMECINKMYNKAIKDNCDIVISDFYKDYNGKYEYVKYNDFKDTNIIDNQELLLNINLGPCNKLYKTSLIKNIKFNEHLKYEDVEFVIKSLVKANKIGKINEALSYYYIHDNSQTTIRDNKMFDIFEINNSVINILNKNKIDKNIITNLSVMLISNYIMQTKYMDNFKSINKFINIGFNELKHIDKYWRSCKYINSFSFIKRIVKKSKILTKLYCFICAFIKKLLRK